MAAAGCWLLQYDQWHHSRDSHHDADWESNGVTWMGLCGGVVTHDEPGDGGDGRFESIPRGRPGWSRGYNGDRDDGEPLPQLHEPRQYYGSPAPVGSDLPFDGWSLWDSLQHRVDIIDQESAQGNREKALEKDVRQATDASNRANARHNAGSSSSSTGIGGSGVTPARLSRTNEKLPTTARAKPMPRKHSNISAARRELPPDTGTSAMPRRPK